MPNLAPIPAAVAPVNLSTVPGHQYMGQEPQPVRRFRSNVDTSGSYNNNQDWIDMQKEYGPEMRNKVIRSTQNPRIGASPKNPPILRYGGAARRYMRY